MNSQLLVPKKIKIGFVKRPDTYTGNLGYVIYNDGKTWRKETSWEGWRDKKIKPVEYDNVPTEGFVLNKKVGGYKSDWNMRQTYSRVYDPRGFEFEINVENLLFILQETNSIKGKGLEGEFVYSWEGKDLVLLPAGCADYQKCVTFTNLQSEKVSTKELVEGGLYETKKQEIYTYIGRFNCYGDVGSNSAYKFKPSYDYVFIDSKGKIVNVSSLTNIAKTIDTNPVADYAALIQKVLKSDLLGKIKSINETKVDIPFYEDQKRNDYYSYHRLEGEEYRYRRGDKEPSLIDKMGVTLFKKISDGVYQQFNLSRIKEEVDKQLNGKEATESNIKYYKEHYFCWKHKGYQLTSTKTIVFENNEIKVKDTKYNNKNILQKEDIQAMSFVGLEAVVKSGKKYNFE